MSGGHPEMYTKLILQSWAVWHSLCPKHRTTALVYIEHYFVVYFDCVILIIFETPDFTVKGGAHMHCINVAYWAQLCNLYDPHPQWKLCATAHSNMIQIHNGIMFDFYVELPCTGTLVPRLPHSAIRTSKLFRRGEPGIFVTWKTPTVDTR